MIRSGYHNNDPVADYLGSWKFAFHALFACILFCLLVSGCNSIRIVQPGFVGVSVFLGNSRDEALPEGVHVVIPFLTRVERIDTRIQKAEASSFEAASKDLQAVKASIIVNYNLKKDMVVKLYREIGINYAEVVILPGIAEVYKATTADFTAESLITKRQTVSEQIKTLLAERLEPYGIIVNQVNVVNFDFSPEFNRAIEAKVTAEQEALRAEKELERVRFEALQAEQKAKGEGAATLEKAKGEALAMLEKAKAEAESLKMRLEFAKPEIALINAIEKWDGKLPMYLFGGQSPMPVFDVTLNKRKE